ncbi:sorbosone dehydrogenase family protein [Sphingomonas sp. SUN039]|uniref:PQQ-dependent sugar dehydrogenase n=1 Tax=Sphingomonas sp. SUN039 TaxID=2937787 RepID=UPI0021647114|nr:sorbosone dehydrogenase family protein [Sphingomonas sp. SUN039]UVO54761.1 sorbosone dehydrogenase family protein [Sphingomonas sp. SUN039]
MTFRAKILSSVLLLVLIGAGALWYLSRGVPALLPVEAVSGTRPKITPARTEKVPTVSLAKPVGWTGTAAPVAAAGLTVAAFARDLDHPRWMYELPNGDVLVAETNSPPREGGGITGWVMTTLMGYAGAGVPSANRITLLRDADGDGVAEVKTPFLTGLNSPFGMALVGDQLYIGNHDALVVVPYVAGETKIGATPKKVMSLPGGGNHWAKNVVAAPDNQSLFISVGSSSNIAEGGMDAEDNRANILELNLATKALRVWTAGLRNPVGMAWEPQSKSLWTVVNERDMLGGDLAPDYLTRADFGAFYGWPYTYWGGYRDERAEDRPDLLQYTRRPDYALGAHTASLGLAFGSLGAFQKGAFIGQHGSWNRKPPSGYKVVFVGFNARGFPEGPMRDVLTGFLDKDGQAQGRPVGVIARSKGDLLVADDVGNRIWRVAAK